MNSEGDCRCASGDEWRASRAVFREGDDKKSCRRSGAKDCHGDCPKSRQSLRSSASKTSSKTSSKTPAVNMQMRSKTRHEVGAGEGLVTRRGDKVHSDMLFRFPKPSSAEPCRRQHPFSFEPSTSDSASKISIKANQDADPDAEAFSSNTSPTPSSTVEWVEAASSNLRLKAEMAETVFETAERLAEVAESRTKELNALEEAYKQVVKELQCYKRLEVKLREEGIVEDRVLRKLKWRVVQETKQRRI